MEIYLYSEISVLTIVLLSIMAVKASKFGIETTPKKKAFVFSMYFTILTNAAEFFWNFGITNTIAYPVIVMDIINAIYFLSLECASYFWFVYSESANGTRRQIKSNYLLWEHLPFVTLLVLLVVNKFTGCLYSFNENFDQLEGPLFYAQHILSFGYIILAVIINAVRFLSSNDYEKKSRSSAMFSFVIPPVACVILQIIFPKLPIISVFPAISFLSIYTTALRVQIALDPLTGINNRRALWGELARKTKNIRVDKKLYFLFIDINDFKHINDTYGHHCGDKVLQLVADALRSFCIETSGYCARYGGDEFALLMELHKDDDISFAYNIIPRKIAEKNENYDLKIPVTVSIGHAEYLKDAKSIQSLINFADKHMYKNKNIKQENK